eukprot:11724911-Alexandrium_andersonii.AAC.1
MPAQEVGLVRLELSEMEPAGECVLEPLARRAVSRRHQEVIHVQQDHVPDALLVAQGPPAGLQQRGLEVQGLPEVAGDRASELGWCVVQPIDWHPE